MITFFACPKPFHGHIDIIQRNAIKSWTLLSPRPEIILLGIEEGTEQVCEDYGLVHIPKIDRNEYGTPLIKSIFQVGQERAGQPIVCYLNSDIILMSDFMRAFKTVVATMSKFLILGQRWNVDMKEAWKFAPEDWETDLKVFVTQKGTLHPPTGIDYLCFPRGIYTDIPPFAVGRPGWDNWMVWRTRSKRVPIVDVTSAVMAVHQNHEPVKGVMRELNAQEVASGKHERTSSNIVRYDGRWVELGPEAQRNVSMAPDDKKNLNIWGATWMIDKKGRLGRRRLTLAFPYLYYQLKYVVPLYLPTLGRIIRWTLKGGKALLRGTKNKIRKAKAVCT